MPIFCEEIENDPLIHMAVYNKVTSFDKAYASPKPDTPLGNQWKFKPCVLPSVSYKRIATEIENFKVYPDDTWVIAFPKCGTTWTQTIVWLLNNNLDYELESKSSLLDRFPFIDLSAFLSSDIIFSKSVVKANNKLRPRNIKSHLPVQLLPKQLWTIKPKIIYVVRNPKDVAVSYFHHLRNMCGYQRTFMDFMNIFMADLVVSSPFHQHFLEFWEMRNEANILFLTYEQMKMNHLGAIKRIANFLDKTNYSDEQLEKLRVHTTVDAMRKNNMVNIKGSLLMYRAAVQGFKVPDKHFQFIRKGQSGTFLDEMSPELIKRFDDWSNAELKNSDFKFSI